MPDVAVIDDPAAAAVVLDPIRSRLLVSLAGEPASAAGLAARLGLPRQKVGYHLNVLQDRGLVAEVEQRRHGGLTERIFAASAAPCSSCRPRRWATPLRTPFTCRTVSPPCTSSRAGCALREVGALLRGADAAGKHLPTLAIDTDLRFRNAAERAAFAEELGDAVRSLASRYHDESAPGGRWHRVVAIAHPKPQEKSSQ